MARRLRVSQAAHRQSRVRGQAVNLSDDAAPRANPASKGRLRFSATRPSSINATTGMSSPPVARGRAAVGRTVRTCRARARASVGGRSRLRANRAITAVNSRNWMRASVSRASTLLPVEKPNTTIPGR